MADLKLKDLKADIEELNALLGQAKRKRSQDLLSIEVRKLETEVIRLQDKLNDVSMETVIPASAAAQQKRYQIKLNGYGWDQSDKYIKVFVTLKGVQNLAKENVYCTLTERSMELHVDNLDNKDYVLIINKLLEPIDVAQCHWKQKTDMVVVFLAKAQAGVKWSHMTEVERRFEDAKASRFKTDEMDKSKDPQESIMSLMKNMYESGDDDMKRMIAKAWTEGQDKKRSSTIDDPML